MAIAASLAMEIHDLSWRHPLCDAFIQACLDRGIPLNSDYNGGHRKVFPMFSAHRRGVGESALRGHS